MPPSSQMVAILQLTLLLISCSLYSMLHSSSSSPSSSSSSAPSSLALLVLLVVSTCLSLLFASLRRLLRDTTAHRGANDRAPAPSMEEAAAAAVFPEKSVVSSSPLPQDEVAEDFTVGGSGTSLSDSSECATTNDDEDEGTEEEGSVSEETDADNDDDDESLIEISLVDGHYVGSEQAEQRRAYNCNYKKDLLADLLPDLLLDRRDFIFDILSEIGEEDDSLIEIDLARGSIKCDVVKA